MMEHHDQIKMMWFFENKRDKMHFGGKRKKSIGCEFESVL